MTNSNPTLTGTRLKTILIAGATGRTGSLLVEQLLYNGHKVRAIVRAPHKLPPEVRNNSNLTIIQASIDEVNTDEMEGYVNGCDAVISCLGHNMDFKGLFGHPRTLCADATQNLCRAIENTKPEQPIKYILMNSVGVNNLDGGDESRTRCEKIILSLLRRFIPPHRDNELAAAYLYNHLNRSNEDIAWSVVRPDSLIDAPVSQYQISTSPTTHLFKGRPTSRANVAHFMVKLIETGDAWSKWKFKMPVITNA